MLNETEIQEIEKALCDLHGLDPEWHKLCGQAADAIRELQRQVAELRQVAQEKERDARRYRWLRERDLDSISKGGVFAGMTPDNCVLNWEDLDNAIDAAIEAETQR